MLMSSCEFTNSGEGFPSGTSVTNPTGRTVEKLKGGRGERLTKPSGTTVPPPLIREVFDTTHFFNWVRGDFSSNSRRQNARQLKALPLSAACNPCSVPVKELKLLAPPPRKSLLYLRFPSFNLLYFFLLFEILNQVQGLP